MLHKKTEIDNYQNCLQASPFEKKIYLEKNKTDIKKEKYKDFIKTIQWY